MTCQGETGISTPDIDTEETNSEWKIFWRVMQFRNRTEPQSSDDATTGLLYVTSNLLTNATLHAAFPNLVCLASLHLVLPVTTSTVERSFSDMKLVKTRLRSRLGEDTLDQAMRVCIEGLERLGDSELEAIVSHWKEQKPRRLVV